MKQLLQVFILGVFIYFGSKIIGNYNKYEGQTAQEWYSDYIEQENIATKYQTCIEEYDSLSEDEKVSTTDTGKLLSGYTPQQLYQAYMKAQQAGDSVTAEYLYKMYEDQTQYQYVKTKLTVAEYCEQ